jgi:hypothetical protein
MRAVVSYVAANPGCNKSRAGRGGSSGPLFTGSVERAIRRGYLSEQRRGGRYQLFVTDSGHRFAAQPASPAGEGT